MLLARGAFGQALHHGPEVAVLEVAGVVGELGGVFLLKFGERKGLGTGFVHRGAGFPIDAAQQLVVGGGLAQQAALLLGREVVQAGAGHLNHAVLHALEARGRHQGQPELQKLVLVHAVHHHVERVDQVFEVAVDAAHPQHYLLGGGLRPGRRAARTRRGKA